MQYIYWALGLLAVVAVIHAVRKDRQPTPSRLPAYVDELRRHRDCGIALVQRAYTEKAQLDLWTFWRSNDHFKRTLVYEMMAKADEANRAVLAAGSLRQWARAAAEGHLRDIQTELATLAVAKNLEENALQAQMVYLKIAEKVTLMDGQSKFGAEIAKIEARLIVLADKTEEQ